MRDAKLRTLAEIIARHAIRALVVTVSSDTGFPFPQAKKKTAGPLEKPWFWAFHYTIQMATLEIFSVGIREPFEIIFDEHKKFGHKAKEFYPYMRSLVPHPIRAVAPIDPLFRTDVDVMPLQAADMIAWLEMKRVLDEPHDWLAPRTVC
jgi:hypothetical protein